MHEIYPKGFLEKEYIKKTPFQRYLHGAIWALNQGLFWKWNWNMLKLWLVIKFKK